MYIYGHAQLAHDGKVYIMGGKGGPAAITSYGHAENYNIFE